MPSNKLASLVGALVFLVLALISLYRLLFWFPISIAGEQVGQTASFFAFVIFAALTLIMFRASRTAT
jgi:hypothetical protein